MTFLKVGVPKEQFGNPPPALRPLPPIQKQPRVPRKKGEIKHG